MGLASKTEISNAERIADATQEQVATAESNLPSNFINLIVIAYPLLLLVLTMGAIAFFQIQRSDPKELPQAQHSVSSQLDANSKNY